MVARQGDCILLIATVFVARALRISGRHDRKRPGLRRADRSVCRCDRGGDCGQRRRALDRHPHGDEKQDGPERRHRDRIQPANRAFCRAGPDFPLLPFRATDGPGIHVPEVVAVVVSVYILFQISEDGETNWIEGIQLLSLYVILGFSFSICRSRNTRAISCFAVNRRFSKTAYARKRGGAIRSRRVSAVGCLIVQIRNQLIYNAKTMAPRLDRWFNKNQTIRDSIVWEYPTPLPGPFSLEGAQPYKNWPERDKGALQTAFDAAWNFASIQLDDPPTNVLRLR